MINKVIRRASRLYILDFMNMKLIHTDVPSLLVWRVVTIQTGAITCVCSLLDLSFYLGIVCPFTSPSLLASFRIFDFTTRLIVGRNSPAQRSTSYSTNPSQNSTRTVSCLPSIPAASGKQIGTVPTSHIATATRVLVRDIIRLIRNSMSRRGRE